MKEVVAETAAKAKEVLAETQVQAKEAIAETQEKIESEAKELNQNIQNQLAQIKQDLLQRIEVIKTQLNSSQGNLVELKDAFKTELNVLIEDLSKVSKELRDDISQISVKHKGTLVGSFKRTKTQAVDAWNKVRAS